MAFTKLPFLPPLLLYSLLASHAHTNVTLGSSLTTAGPNSSWRSPSGDFAFGFYPLAASGLFLVGIWSDKIAEKTLVWSANRDAPAPAGSIVSLTEARRLVLIHPNGTVCPIYNGGAANSASIQDDGNFVVRNSASQVLWQSSDHPAGNIFPDEILIPICTFSPKTIFIMGGGEGSTARELLRHKTVDKVVMCDIDEEVVDFCKSYLVVNREAFCDPRLELIINDARAELEIRKECFDVIIGDLADPIEGGPCYQLYTKSFYEFTVKPRLNQGGVFVTQAGPAGVFSHTEVFSCIYNTLRQVFKYVVPYSAHIPSFADTWGWVMASDSPFVLNAEEFDLRMKQRIKGENRYLDGKTFSSASTLSKAVRKS
ncbi:hypothetical protein L1049_017447 [Liquidambar formosana]|uniref:PABS domain-containing protein n=1 Tax=Liquidambar formosana TaxID=63359 RepID=A0AAP0S7Z2_LIQFO